MKSSMLLLFAVVGLALSAPAPAPKANPQLVYSYPAQLAYPGYAAPAVVATDPLYTAGYVPYSYGAAAYGYNYPYVYV